MSTIEKPDRDISKLCPQFREMVLGALNELQLMGHDVQVYEAARSSARQAWLYQSGRSRPGPIVTRANAGQSPHEYFVAADLVAKVENRWCWDETKVPYKEFRKVYDKHGLTCLQWETVHVEFLGPFKAKELADFVRLHGMEALHARIFAKA